MTREEFREALNRAEIDVDVYARQEAADVLLRHWPRDVELGRPQLDSAVELARRLRSPDNQPFLGPTDRSASVNALHARWMATLTPSVERFRELAFGSSSPPFGPKSWIEAVRWIERELEAIEGKNMLPARPSSGEVSPVERFQREVMTRAYERTRYTLEFVSSDTDEIEQREIKGFSRFLLGSDPIPPVALLAEVTTELAEVTGYPQYGIVSWVLADVEPRFSRFSLQSVTRSYRSLDGSKVRSTRLEVRFHTPDVTHKDLREVHRMVQAVWHRERSGSSRSVPATRSRWTEKDTWLANIVDALGGPPSRPSGEWWVSVAEEWEERGHKSTTPSALRKRWERLEKKRAERLDPADLPEDAPFP